MSKGVRYAKSKSLRVDDLTCLENIMTTLAFDEAHGIYIAIATIASLDAHGHANAGGDGERRWRWLRFVLW